MGWGGGGGHVTDMEQKVIITNNNLLFHLSSHSNDQLVLKQWKGVLNRIMPLLLGLLKNKDLVLHAQSLFLRRPQSSCIIVYIIILYSGTFSQYECSVLLGIVSVRIIEK